MNNTNIFEKLINMSMLYLTPQLITYLYVHALQRVKYISTVLINV